MNQNAIDPRFSFGNVFSLGFSVFFSNFFSFTLLAIIVFFPSFLLRYYGFEAALRGQFRAYNYVLWALDFLLPLLVAAALSYGTYRYLNNKPTHIIDNMVRGIQLIFPIIILTIVLAVIFMLAFIVFGLPGFILAFLGGAAGGGGLAQFGMIIGAVGGFIAFAIVYTMFWVVVPTMVIERPGIFDSLGRSRSLTYGHRWAIFGILVVVTLMATAVGFVVGLLFVPSFPFTPDKFLPLFVATWIVSAVFGALGAVFVAVGYFLLRAQKEGTTADAIASVFD